MEWAKQIGGDTTHTSGVSIAVDDNGNVITVGTFSGAIDLDPGPGVFTVVGNSTQTNTFISKLDASGNFIWGKRFSGSTTWGAAHCFDMALDNAGNIYTIGYFNGIIDFDPGPGTYNLGGCHIDIFISKLDSSGNFVWAKQFLNNTGVFSIGWAITVDDQGYVYSTGFFDGSSDFDPGVDTFSLTSTIPYNPDAFISKLDPSGNFVWAKQIVADSIIMGLDIAIGTEGVYTTGKFCNNADFDPGPAVYNLTSSGDYDAYISLLDHAGNFLWTKQFGGADADIGHGITIDPMENIYVTGEFRGTVDFDPGPGVFNLTSSGQEDIFVTKLDGSTNLIWTKKLGGNSYDAGNAITLDQAGNVYTTGYFRSTVDFDPGPATFNITAWAGHDVFIHQLTPTGDFGWANHLSSPWDNVSYSCAVDPSYNVYTTGYFHGTGDFDPGPGNFTMLSPNNQDAFIHKLSQCFSTTSNISPSVCNSYISPSGNYSWTTSGTYLDTLPNAAGCDSFITIHLTVIPTNSSIIAYNCDDDYISPSGLYTWTSSGIYSDTLANVLGCDSIITIDLIFITPDVSVSPASSYLLANANLVSYQWMYCDSAIIAGEIGQSFIVPANGSYAVIINDNGCVDTSSCYQFTNIGLEENLENNDWKIYPNPTYGDLQIDLGKDYSEVNVVLRNALSQVIKFENLSSANQVALNMQIYSNGMYLLEINTANGQSKHFKVLKK